MFYDDTSMLNYVYVIGLDNDNYNDYIKKLGLKEKRPIVVNKYSKIEYVKKTRKAINTKIFDYVDDFYVNYPENDLEKEKKYTFNNEMIGKRLKEFRKENGITQVKLAEFLNTTQSTISAYESGKTTLLTAFALQIVDKYKISLDWLCGRK